MKRFEHVGRALATVAGAFALWSVAGPVAAQSPAAALPTAPGANKAVQGPPTAARASLPGDNGSPVEPYLFLFILAGGGLICGGACIAADRYVRSGR